jgi:hypothetical protein
MLKKYIPNKRTMKDEEWGGGRRQVQVKVEVEGKQVLLCCGPAVQRLKTKDV